MVEIDVAKNFFHTQFMGYSIVIIPQGAKVINMIIAYNLIFYESCY